MSYRAAIDDTVCAINKRATMFRRQSVTIVSLLVSTVAVALIRRTPSMLAALLFLVPVSGGFMLADARILTRWRHSLLDAWTRGEIDVAAFQEAIRAHPRLPQQTLDGMLATLPLSGDLVAEQAVRGPTRRAIAAANAATHGLAIDTLLLKAVAGAIVAMVTWAALWTASWQALIGFAVMLVLVPARVVMRRRRLSRRDAHIAACRLQDGFSDAD